VTSRRETASLKVSYNVFRINFTRQSRGKKNGGKMPDQVTLTFEQAGKVLFEVIKLAVREEEQKRSPSTTGTAKVVLPSALCLTEVISRTKFLFDQGWEAEGSYKVEISISARPPGYSEIQVAWSHYF